MNWFSVIYKRLVGIAVVVVIATFLLSCLMWLLPGDPAELLNPSAPEGAIEVIRREIGLDRGVFGYYWHWLSNLLTGNFGKYYLGGGEREVSEVVLRTLPVSIQMITYAQIVSLSLAIPLGLISAYKEKILFL